jgi:hypothetical protein
MPMTADLGGVSLTAGTPQFSGSLTGYLRAFWLQGASMPTGTQTLTVTPSSAVHLSVSYALYDNVTALTTPPTFASNVSTNPLMTVATAVGHVVSMTYRADAANVPHTANAPAVSQYQEVGYGPYAGITVDALVASGSSININTTCSSTTGWGGFAWDMTGTISAPTILTLTGPSSGTVSVASTNFTVGTDSTITSGSFVCTPSDGGDGGTFSPTTVTLNSATQSATFTYTPASTGVKTISISTSGLIAPSNLSYTSNAVANPPPTFPGPNISNISAVNAVAITPVSTASKFSDSDTLTYSAQGIWPVGITVNASTGVISGTSSALGTYATCKVRATDTASQFVESNVFTITVAVATGSMTFGPMSNNAGSLWPSGTAVKLTWYPGGRVGVLSGITPVEMDITLGSGGLATTTATLAKVAGCGFIVKQGADALTDSVYYQAGTPA